MDANNYDAILCPISPLVAFPHGTTTFVPNPMPFVHIFNTTGMPAGVAPTGCVQPGEECSTTQVFFV